MKLSREELAAAVKLYCETLSEGGPESASIRALRQKHDDPDFIDIVDDLDILYQKTKLLTLVNLRATFQRLSGATI